MERELSGLFSLSSVVVAVIEIGQNHNVEISNIISTETHRIKVKLSLRLIYVHAPSIIISMEEMVKEYVLIPTRDFMILSGLIDVVLCF